jgi:hypothetical protein
MKEKKRISSLNGQIEKMYMPLIIAGKNYLGILI